MKQEVISDLSYIKGTLGLSVLSNMIKYITRINSREEGVYLGTPFESVLHYDAEGVTAGR